MKYDDTYAVEETFQLFKIPWEWYDPSHVYDVVIARRGEVDTAGAFLVDLSEKDYFAEIARILNEGLPHCHEPVVEILIDELRQILKEHTLLVEIPPMPWGYSYIVTLTHDVDITSVRERRWVSVGYAVYQCLRKGMVKDAARILGAKCGIGKDPWNCFEEWMRLEEDLGVRSTWFFLPEKGKAGEGAPAIRAGYYDLDPELIKRLTDGGWEVGVHGLDNWRDARAAREELRRVTDLTGNEAGTRVHWLLFDKDSWKKLDEAGYSYDSTFGYNDDVGFRAGTMQPYRPRGCERLLEVPLHIQDVGLFGTFCWLPKGAGWDRVPCLHLSEDEAKKRCAEIFQYAQQYGGVVTLLWHHESLSPPHRWDSCYHALIEMALGGNARVIPARLAYDWYCMRRNIRIYAQKKDDLTIIIEIVGDAINTILPRLMIRVFAGSKKIKYPSFDYSIYHDYLDIPYEKHLIEVHFDDA